MSHWVALTAISAFYFLLSPQVALPGLSELGSRMLDVGCSVFSISLPNTTRLPRLPRGGLVAPWTNPGHVLVP